MRRGERAMTAIRKLDRTSRLAFTLAILVAGTSCTGDAPPAQSSQSDDGLPAAVLGMAGPLRGQSVAYFAGDEATVGYLAVPEGAANLSPTSPAMPLRSDTWPSPRGQARSHP